MPKVTLSMLIAATAVADNRGSEVSMTFERNQRVGREGEPTSLSFDATLHVVDRLQVTFTQSSLGRGRLHSGAGLCLKGGGLCDSDAFRVGGRILLSRGSYLSHFMEMGLGTESYDEGKNVAYASIESLYNSSLFNISAKVILQGGVSNISKGNRSRLTIPVSARLMLRPNEKINLGVGLRTDIDGPLQYFSDYYQLSLAPVISVGYDRWELATFFGFDSIIGPRASFLERKLLVRLTFRY